jgi:hypothetical protein
MDRAMRRSADGRRPVKNGTTCFDVAIQQIRASDEGAGAPSAHSTSSVPPPLEIGDLTVLTAWSEAVAEILAQGPERVEAVLGDALAGSPWRAELGLPEPSSKLSQALESMANLVRSATSTGIPLTFDAVLGAAETTSNDEAGLDGLARRALLSMLEQRRTRQR